MGQIIALDSMIFIYLFEADTRYLKAVKTLLFQIESGQSQGFTSVISVIEALSPAKYLTDTQTATEISRFFSETPHLEIVPISYQIGLETAKLRQKFPQLRTPDAIQLATALYHKANTFITNDQKLKSIKIDKLTIQFL